MNDSNAHRAFCIPTIRLAEATETIRQYDHNLSSYGHRIPMIIFSDASPERTDDDGHPLFPSYAKDYRKLQEVALAAHNDIYIVTPEDKANAINHILPYLLRRRPDSKLLSKGLLKNALTTPWGGNHNSTLMYTCGWNVIICEDDVRPYQLMAKGHDAPNPQTVWSGVEVAIPDNANAYETLTEITRSPNRNASSALFTVRSPDIYDAFFSVLGKTSKSIQNERGAEHVQQAYSMRYSDRNLYMATTLPTYGILADLLDTEHYPRQRDGQRINAPLSPLHGAGQKLGGHGVKRYPYHLQTVSESHKTQQAIVRFAIPVINSGVPDYNAVDFLEYMLGNSSALHRYDMHAVLATTFLTNKTTLLDGYFAMSANILGVANGPGVGPSFMGFRMNDLGARLDALAPASLSTILPINQLHIQSPQGRESIGEAVYLETLGCIAKPLLYNALATGDLRNANARAFTPHAAAKILKEIKTYYIQASQQLSENDIDADRNSFLMNIMADLNRYFEHFDTTSYYEKAIKELEEKLNLYTAAHDIWPDLQAVTETQRDHLMLRHVATGEQLSMNDLLEKNAHTPVIT